MFNIINPAVDCRFIYDPSNPAADRYVTLNAARQLVTEGIESERVAEGVCEAMRLSPTKQVWLWTVADAENPDDSRFAWSPTREGAVEARAQRAAALAG